MRTKTLCALSFLISATLLHFSCKKEKASLESDLPGEQKIGLTAKKVQPPDYDLNVNLKGLGDYQGHLKFRQDPDAAKIIELNIKVHNLLPDHEYLLQRAVDPINLVDGDCTSTFWLTLGEGLTARSIVTNSEGNGEEDLWRDISAVPSESAFDIHFQVIDAVSLATVLTGDCYQYKVR